MEKQKNSLDKNILRQRKAFDYNRVYLSDSRYRKIYGVLKKIKPGKILEVGCSDGEFLSFLKRKGWITKGLEISEKAAKRAKTKGIDVSVHDANQKFPLKENSFDVIVAGEVIEHLFEDTDFLNECHKVLKKEGILIVTTPNLISLKNRLLMLFGLDPRYAIAPHHYRVYTPRGIKKLFSMSKFKKMKMIGNFIIYSRGRERIFGSVFEKLADWFPELSEHFIIVSKKQ